MKKSEGRNEGEFAALGRMLDGKSNLFEVE
jgi:hypothetical protein